MSCEECLKHITNLKKEQIQIQDLKNELELRKDENVEYLIDILNGFMTIVLGLDRSVLMDIDGSVYSERDKDIKARKVKAWEFFKECKRLTVVKYLKDTIEEKLSNDRNKEDAKV